MFNMFWYKTSATLAPSDGQTCNSTLF